MVRRTIRGRDVDAWRIGGETAARAIVRRGSIEGGLQMHVSAGRRFSMAAAIGRL